MSMVTPKKTRRTTRKNVKTMTRKSRQPRAKRSLATYQAKRDFTRSPEPSGIEKIVTRAPGKRFFCVQKHDASRLHYDFRLEHRGVLLSWAVPKGPSLNPKDKRLAMQVEDHPLDYGDFEGTISSGYGAGTVLLWDRGTWTPEGDDVDAALADGELKFSLTGTKLKGSWVLVRTHGKFGGAGKEGWLLIKHRDEWAGDVDVTKIAPQSVKSFKTIEEIEGMKGAKQWKSHR